MKIVYNKLAIEDMQNTQNYIIENFHDEKVAKKLSSKIFDAVSLLLDNPHMEAKLCEKFDVDTNIRFLIIQKHIVFYEIFNEEIEILRVLDSRQDYLAILF